MARINGNYIAIDDLFINPDDDEPIRMPYFIQEIFLEMTLEYLIEKPEDALDFCCNYFNKLKVKLSTSEISDSILSPENILGEEYNYRRETVYVSDDFGKYEEDDVQKIVYPKSEFTRVRLRRSLKDIILFSHLSDGDLNIIIDAMRYKDVNKGETIITQGDDGQELFIIDSGEYTAFINEDGRMKELTSYKGYGYFGELALLYNAPRAASVVATSAGSLWVLDRGTFRRIVIKQTTGRRNTLTRLLTTVPILSALTPIERIKLAESMVDKNFSNGQTIIKENEEADGMYFVRSGSVNITKSDPKTGEETLINTLHVGDFFGEVALIEHKPRMASAKASGNVILAFIDVDTFERLLGPCIEIMKRQFETYEERIKEVFGK